MAKQRIIAEWIIQLEPLCFERQECRDVTIAALLAQRNDINGAGDVVIQDLQIDTNGNEAWVQVDRECADDVFFIRIRYLVGRCANGAERDKGRLWHAINKQRALCGAKPGRRSAGWGPFPPIRKGEVPERPTCKKCLRKLNKIESCLDLLMHLTTLTPALT